MTMKTIIVGAACALIGGAATAGAQPSHIFGNGGAVYTFDAACHRVTFVPPGITDHEAVNLVGQQVRCLVRRPDPFARCVKRLGAAPTVTLYRRDDWKGVGKLARYVANVGLCSKASY